MGAGLNNPSTVVDVDLTRIVDKVDSLNEEVSSLRTTSTPIPPGLIDEDYTAHFDEQRLIHVSPNPHTLTLPSSKSIYRRRGLVRNADNCGDLMVEGAFIGANLNPMAMLVNPVLKAGEGLEWLGIFELGGGDEPAPDDLYINGELAPANTVGQYRTVIVLYDKAKLPPDFIVGWFESLENKLDVKTSWTENEW